MARKLRVQYEGAIYHVMNRGDRREPIFLDDRDRECFLETLEETCRKTSWQIHAYCLMPNHFHLVLETTRANLVPGMKWMLGTYTARFNRRHKFFGHLFSGRYKALVVDGSAEGYLRTVCDYVHLNPARAKMLREKGALHRHRWSSYPSYLLSPGKRPVWLRVDRLLGECGIQKDHAPGRKRFEARMEARRWEEDEEVWKKIRRGWYLGDKSFKKELLEELKEGTGSKGGGDAVRELEEARAERMVREELKRNGLASAQLSGLRKGDQRKIRIAKRLRKETTMSMKWIAQRLGMGTAGYLANLLSA